MNRPEFQHFSPSQLRELLVLMQEACFADLEPGPVMITKSQVVAVEAAETILRKSSKLYELARTILAYMAMYEQLSRDESKADILADLYKSPVEDAFREAQFRPPVRTGLASLVAHAFFEQVGAELLLTVTSKIPYWLILVISRILGVIGEEMGEDLDEVEDEVLIGLLPLPFRYLERVLRSILHEEHQDPPADYGRSTWTVEEMRAAGERAIVYWLRHGVILDDIPAGQLIKNPLFIPDDGVFDPDKLDLTKLTGD